MNREQMESMLALDGWEPVTIYGCYQLKRDHLRTTGWPVTVFRMVSAAGKTLKPTTWSAIPDNKFNGLFRGVYRYEGKWR